MDSYSRSHLPDPVLLHDLKLHLAVERSATATVLADLAEFDERKLYLPAAYPSMYAYCVGELHLSEDAAYKRIQAARTARRFPSIFPMVADGRLHLAAVCLLAPHLTPVNAEELLKAAEHRSKAEVEQLLAERFPRSEILPLVQELPAAPEQQGQLSPGTVAQLAPGQVETHADPRASGRIEAAAPRPVAPIAAQRFALQLTVGQSTYDKLQYAQALLGHSIPSGEIAPVIDRALDALIGQLEKRKFAATSKPRPRPRRRSASPRHIPAAVKRAVWERDGGQCTFESASGKRCPARSRLEFDHVEPVARGGRATVENIRLRCRAHNQHEAERAFGAGFMHRKREERRGAAEGVRVAAAEQARAIADDQARMAAAKERERAAAAEVIPWLRALGLRADEAKWAAERCEARSEATLEDRVKAALTCFARPRHGPVVRSQRAGA